MFDRSLHAFFSILKSLEYNSNNEFNSLNIAHNTIIMNYELQRELQEEHKKIVNEVTEAVLRNLSVSANTQQAIQKIDSLNKAIERLGK